MPFELFCQAVRVAVVAEDDDATTVMTWVALPTLTGMANGTGGGAVGFGVVLAGVEVFGVDLLGVLDVRVVVGLGVLVVDAGLGVDDGGLGVVDGIVVVGVGCVVGCWTAAG